MNKRSISYLRTYINRYPTLDNLRYITKILNYLYYKFPDIRQIPDLRTRITIDEYIEVFNNNLDLYGIKDINNFDKVDDVDVRFSYNKDSYIKTGDYMNVGKLSDIIFEAILNNIVYTKMTDCYYRMDMINYDFNNWNQCVAIDIDYKVAIDKFNIDPLEIYNNVTEWLKHNSYSFLYGELSRSGKGFHFIFNSNVPKNEDGTKALMCLADLIVKQAFTCCGYSKIIYYPKVFDSCTKSLAQGIYITGNNPVINENYDKTFNLDYNIYKQYLIPILSSIKYNSLDSLVNHDDDKIEELKTISYNKLCDEIDNIRTNYVPNRNHRWLLFNELYSILVHIGEFNDENLKEVWCKTINCFIFTEHPLSYYYNEPYRGDWNKKKQSKKFPYTLKQMGIKI